MEQFVLNVQTLSGQGNFHELADYLSKSTEMLDRNSGQLSNVLETLDIQQHSLGVLAVMTVQLQQSNIANWDDLFNRVSVFLCECNGEQIRHSPHQFAELCHVFTNKLIDKDVPLLGLPPLLKAVNKIQLSDTSLTSVASDVFKICLATKCFPPALKLLKSDLTDIAKEATVDPKYILLYFYYGALILTAVKDYERALYYLEACVTIPAMVVSHIMLESYKKYLLISLIVSGDRAKDHLILPKYTSPVVGKYIRPLCNPYHELVNAFFTNSMSELQAAITQYGDVFAADKNSGLVAQVKDSLLKTSIKRLTKTFLTLSLEDVASRVGLSSPREAERWLVIMIEEGSIHATISQKDGMVRFDTNPERFASVSMLKKLESSVKESIKLDAQILTMDEEILVNPNFIKKSNVGAAPSGQRKNSDFEIGDEGLLSSSPNGPRPCSSGSGIDGFFARQTPPPPGNSN